MRDKKHPVIKTIVFILLLIVFYVGASSIFSAIVVLFQSVGALFGGGEMPEYKLIYLVKPIDTIPFYLPMILSAVLTPFSFVKFSRYAIRAIKPRRTVEGSGRWATQKEISKMLVPVRKDNIESAEKSGIILASDESHFYIDNELINALIIGTTRSGKGQVFVLPMIRLICKSRDKHSMVVNDPKGELAENSYDLLTKNGYKVVILNFRNPGISSRWNPLSNIIEEYIKGIGTPDKDISKAVELAGELAYIITDDKDSEPIWPNSAKSLLTAMILYLLEKGYEHECLDKLNMYSVYNFFIEYGTRTHVVNKKEVNALDELFKRLPVGNPAKLAYATSNFAKGEMRSSIFSTLSSNMQIFSDIGIAKLTSGMDIVFNDLIDPKQPCALFMVVPDEKENRHMLASLFINQCYSHLVDLANEFQRQKLPQRVQFILDEFGNMVRIPSFDVKITVCLGRNILFSMFVQALSQIDGKYGKDAASTIKGNCGNLVYLNSIDKETNEYVSAVLGKETIEYDNYMGDMPDIFENRITTHLKGRELMTPDELPKMQFGEFVVIRQRCYPVHTNLEPYYTFGETLTQIDNMDVPRDNTPLANTMFPLDLIEEERIFTEGSIRKDRGVDKINAALNRVNTLTKGIFGKQIKAKNFRNCLKQLEGLLNRKQISFHEVEILDYAIREMEKLEEMQ